MPKVKIEKVLSFSSEDPIHLANNILSTDPSKKWKCQSVGEKSANLVLQLQEPVVISSIDIGNEHSAYIEVLVKRSCSNEDFTVLLVMSSFMSPLESRQSTNIHKVRMFTHDQLSDRDREEKWDQVKIVCTQPFNRHVQYGLSFINFHTVGKDEEKQVTPHFGRFALRPDSPINITTGSLFARKEDLLKNKPVTAAAAIREASYSPQETAPNSKKIKLAQTARVSNDIQIPHLSRKREEILYDKDEEEPNEKIDTIIEQKKIEKEQASLAKVEQLSKQDDGRRVEKHHINKLEDSKPNPSVNGESSKRKSTVLKNTFNKKAKTVHERPFAELLNDVVIVISGIQNPDRMNIRAMAISMGAKYKADWDNTCTHLVCAFPNTPKFNQVKGKGKIVKKAWIYDCHTNRKRLPWRRYALDKTDNSKDESEEEISEKMEERNDDDDSNRCTKSGSDTEDEIERIHTLQQQKFSNDNTAAEKTKGNEDKKDDDQDFSNKCKISHDRIFDIDTDDELQINATNNECPLLPNIFQNEVFYIDTSLSEKERKTLDRYITACNGIIATPLTDHVHFVITTKEYKFQLPNLTTKNIIVHPNFVFDCFNSKKLQCFENYVV